jgi:hypothetical protein
MATNQISSPSNSPQGRHRSLAMKLADACSNPSYSPDLWAAHFKTFHEVLAKECVEPVNCGGAQGVQA